MCYKTAGAGRDNGQAQAALAGLPDHPTPGDAAARLGRRHGHHHGAAALHLFEREWGGRAVRLIGVGVSSFQEGARQMNLWEQPDERSERLYGVVQELRRRYGEQVVRRGSELREQPASK